MQKEPKFFEGKRWVKSKDEVPTEPHYAVMEFGSAQTPGYDVGDPPDTIVVISYIVFENRQVWEKYIADNEKRQFGRTPLVAIFVNPAKISTHISVAVETPKMA